MHPSWIVAEQREARGPDAGLGHVVEAQTAPRRRCRGIGLDLPLQELVQFGRGHPDSSGRVDPVHLVEDPRDALAGECADEENGNLLGEAQPVAPAVFGIAGVFTDPQFQVMIRALNAQAGQDDRVDCSLIPLGDGLLLARKK